MISRVARYFTVKVLRQKGLHLCPLCDGHVISVQMGKMTDGTDCLICEQQKDCDSPEQLILCCRECQSEVAFLLAENKYDFYFRRDV